MVKKETVFLTGLYLRLSKEDKMQNNESMSISNQRKLTVRFAKDNKLVVVEIYVDDGYSGVNFDNRPAFKQMIRDLETGKINCVVVKDMSRLGRDDVEANRYYEDVFLANNYRFIAIDDNVDTLRGYEQHATFKNMFNSMYPRDISQKTHSAYIALALNGDHVGKPPYGLKKDPENRFHLIIDEESAKVVRHIFELALQGHSRKRIARMLRDEKILCPAAYAKMNGCVRYEQYLSTYNDDCMWCDKTVGEMLTSEFYIGSNVGNTSRRSFKTGKCTKIPRDEWIIVPDRHEAIISKEVFYRVQELIKSRKRGTKMETVQIFSGVIKCKDCSRAMNYAGGKTPIYNCGTYRNKGKEYCSSHYIRYEDVYNCVLYDIHEKTLMLQKDKNEFYQSALKHNEKKLQEDTKYQQAKLKELKKRSAELDVLIQKTYENSVLGTLSQERMAMFLAKYEDEQSDVKKAIDEITAQLQSYKQTQEDARDFTALIEKYIGIKELTAEIVIELIDKIEIGEKYIIDGKTYQDIDITYRFVGNIAA